MSNTITIKLASALSEHKALFWRTQAVDKDMFVEDLIKTRLPDMSYYDSEHIYAVRNRTGEILDKDNRLRFCGLEEGEEIKIMVLTSKDVEKACDRNRRPLHPDCHFMCE